MRPGGGYVPNFQLFEKGDVNGDNEQKVFSFLKVSEQAWPDRILWKQQGWYGGWARIPKRE